MSDKVLVGRTELVLERITENLDRRRLEITNLRRVVLGYLEKPLESTAARMAIVMVYAHWEGYVKEVCQLYLEFVESAVTCCRELQPALLGYLWTPMLRPLTGGINIKRKTAVAESALYSLGEPVLFPEAEKTIDTRANLNYSILETIASSLCLDISKLATWRPHLNSLVHLRNNIAHGALPGSLTYSDFDDHASVILALMEDFELVLMTAVRTRAFCTT